MKKQKNTSGFEEEVTISCNKIIEKQKNIVSYKERNKLIKWQIVSIIGLNLSYILVISKQFSYMGYMCDFNPTKLIISTLILIISLFIGRKIDKPYFFAVWNIMFLYLLGGEVIYYQYNPDANFIQMLVILVCLIFLYLFSKIRKTFKRTRYFKNPDRAIGMVALLLFIPFVMFYYKHINLKNLFLVDVYKTRAIFRNLGNVFTGYITAPLARVLIPVLIIRKRDKKQYAFMLLYSFMLIYLYLCGALKSIFFGLLAAIFFYNGTYQQKAIRFVKAISCLTYTGTLIYYIFGNVFLLDAPIRRVFLVPARLGNIYWEFFKDNLTYLSHSPFGLSMIDYPYDRGITRYVGEVVMGSPGLNANVGLFTEGIISFGFIGGVMGALIVSLVILYFSMINIDEKYFGLIFVYIYYMNTSLLSTLLLTHGLFFFMVFAYIFLRSREVIKGQDILMDSTN